MLDSDDGLSILSRCLDPTDPDTMMLCVSILAAVCIYEPPWGYVLLRMYPPLLWWQTYLYWHTQYLEEVYDLKLIPLQLYLEFVYFEYMSGLHELGSLQKCKNMIPAKKWVL